MSWRGACGIVHVDRQLLHGSDYRLNTTKGSMFKRIVETVPEKQQGFPLGSTPGFSALTEYYSYLRLKARSDSCPDTS